MDSSGNLNVATFHSFETSAKIIERANWKIQVPIVLQQLTEDGARSFVKNPPLRDKRRNLAGSRFRLLLVKLPDWCQLVNQRDLLATAIESDWVSNEFVHFIKTGNGGSSVSTRAGNISLIMQAPRDDLPFITLCITQLNQRGHPKEADWVCLLFTNLDIDLQSLLCEDPFPSDYAPLSPDFMILPAGILRWQVEQTRDSLLALIENVIDEEKLAIKTLGDLDAIKDKFFELEKAHLKLRNRWLFERELAENIARCFNEIERRHSTDNSPALYSKTLRQRVETQANLSMTLQRDFDTIPSQHKMIGSQLNIMIARNSAIAAEETRRDSSSMKTIATVTLVFLPSTTIASIFSMSMFNWQAKEGETVVSNYLWMYFVVAIPLTLLVLLVWILWFTWTQSRFLKKHGDDVERVLQKSD